MVLADQHGRQPGACANFTADRLGLERRGAKHCVIHCQGHQAERQRVAAATSRQIGLRVTPALGAIPRCPLLDEPPCEHGRHLGHLQQVHDADILTRGHARLLRAPASMRPWARGIPSLRPSRGSDNLPLPSAGEGRGEGAAWQPPPAQGLSACPWPPRPPRTRPVARASPRFGTSPSTPGTAYRKRSRALVRS